MTQWFLQHRVPECICDPNWSGKSSFHSQWCWAFIIGAVAGGNSSTALPDQLWRSVSLWKLRTNGCIIKYLSCPHTNTAFVYLFKNLARVRKAKEQSHVASLQNSLSWQNMIFVCMCVWLHICKYLYVSTQKISLKQLKDFLSVEGR